MLVNFLSSGHLDTSDEVSSQSVQEKKLEIDFQDVSRGGHVGFPIRTIVDIFDLQVAPILPIKFRVYWPFH